MSALVRQAPRLLAGALATCAAAVAGCAPVLDSSSSWSITMADPEPTVNEFGQAEVEWCPGVMQPRFDPVTGQETAAALANAPSNFVTSIFVEDEDIYTVSPFPDPIMFGPPVVFDIGPIGTFYEAQDEVKYEVSGGNATPATIGMTRRLIDGSADDDDAFTLVLEYEMSCGADEGIERLGVTCDCETQRITIDAVGTF